MKQGDSLRELAAQIEAFNREREWGRYHQPKDLAMALSVEASELLELFLWKGEALPPRERLEEEMADVLMTLVNLATKLDVDLLAASADKMKKNALKYPIDRARGSAKKWDELVP